MFIADYVIFNVKRIKWVDEEKYIMAKFAKYTMY